MYKRQVQSYINLVQYFTGFRKFQYLCNNNREISIFIKIVMRNLRWLFPMFVFVALYGCGGKQANSVQKPVRVKVRQVDVVQVNGENSYSGTVEEESGVSLSFPVAGTVQRMAVDEGQMVRRGQLVATVNATGQIGALQSAHAVTQQAREAYRQALDTYNRSKGLHQSGVISDSKWVQAQTALAEAREGVRSSMAMETVARKGTGDTRLMAPFSGYISEKAADVGQNVLPGAMVVKLVHIDRVKVSISVPEDEVNQIRNGEVMMIRCAAIDGAVFYGKVIEKGVTADPLSRTYDVKLLVDNAGHKLLPGMICQVYSRFSRGHMSVFVPANVVQINPDNKMFVWIVKNGRATKRYINYLSDTSQGVRVNGGLDPGDMLIVEGQQKVSEGTRCEIIK